MKPGTVIVGAVTLLAGGALLAGILKSVLPGTALVQTIPLTISLEGYEEAEARRWHSEILRLLPAVEVDNTGSEAANLDVHDRILELGLSRPELLAEPDLAATVVQFIRSLGETSGPSLPASSLASLCLAIRWTPVRLQPIARDCERALSESEESTQTLSARLDLQSIVILNPTSSLSRAARSYRANPYRSGPITALATELAKLGQFQPAWRLHEELVQLDLLASAKLMSELSRLEGLHHRSHELPY